MKEMKYAKLRPFARSLGAYGLKFSRPRVRPHRLCLERILRESPAAIAPIYETRASPRPEPEGVRKHE